MSYIPRAGWRGRFLAAGASGLNLRPPGLGDVLNPTAGTSLDCGLFAGGVFKPECWAKTLGPTKLLGKTIVSEDDYRAALALAHPDLAYPPMPLPVAPPAVSAGTSTVPAPYGTPLEFSEAVSAAIEEGARQTRAAAQSYFESTAAGQDAMVAAGNGLEPTAGYGWWPWVLLGGLVVVGLAVTGRRR